MWWSPALPFIGLEGMGGKRSRGNQRLLGGASRHGSFELLYGPEGRGNGGGAGLGEEAEAT
jgi:hypothetical protein